MNILAVGIGGFAGAVLRYGLGQGSKMIFPSAAFPVGTFLANILGAFFMGIAFQYFTKNGMMGTNFQLFIMVGLMGGFTTFSSFSLEAVNLMASGKAVTAFIYVAASAAVCFAGIILGKSCIG